SVALARFQGSRRTAGRTKVPAWAASAGAEAAARKQSGTERLPCSAVVGRVAALGGRGLPQQPLGSRAVTGGLGRGGGGHERQHRGRGVQDGAVRVQGERLGTASGTQ